MVRNISNIFVVLNFLANGGCTCWVLDTLNEWYKLPEGTKGFHKAAKKAIRRINGEEGLSNADVLAMEHEFLRQLGQYRDLPYDIV